MDRYDVVVIGAGNGGLTASATLAKKGLNVLLLERHNVPGGCGTTFCRGRFEFEVALHQLSGIGTPEMPGPLRSSLAGLGVLDDLELVQMPDMYAVHMPDGFSIALKADRNATLTELQNRFPAEKEAIERFMDLVYTFAGQMLSAFHFKDPEASREKYPILYQYAFKNCKEVLDAHFRDPVLKSVLAAYWGYLGVSPNRLTFAYLALLLFSFLELKPYHLKGGSQAMSSAIFNRFLSHGGTARFNCGVKRILVRDDAVRGVLTDDGEEIQADYVVSNVSTPATYLQLIEPGRVPEEALVEMRGRSLSTSAFTMYIGCDCEPGDLSITETTNFILPHLDIEEKPMDDMYSLDASDGLMVISCYDVADPDFSPPGACQLNVVTLKKGEPWLRVPPHQYFKTKYRTAEGMLQTIEKVFPGVRAHIEEIEVGTPLTHMRYLGHPNGAIYGFEMLPKDSLFLQPGRETPIKGLFLAGGWAGDPGFQPTLESGIAAAKSIIRAIGA